MFGLFRPRSGRPAAQEPQPGPPVAESGPVLVNTAHGVRPIYVARQPIFNRGSQVHGYEILFRSGPENRFSATDIDAASAISIEQSTSAFGLDHLVGDRLAFVNLTREALLSEYYRMLPPGRAVIELLETIAPDAEVLAACRKAKDEGYQLALDDYVNAPQSEPLLDLVDIVKVDLRGWRAGYKAAAIASLRKRGLKLLAEKVETHEEHHDTLAAGYDLLQGYYYCKPQMIEQRDLAPSKLSQLRFLAEVSREDASYERLEEVFRADVGLTMRLLRYLNSAAFGWRHEVNSLRHALALMGLRPLRKWATMMGIMSLSDGQPPELAVTALARGRFAEQIGPPAGLPRQELELFLAGMLSLVDVMVGRPIQEIVSQLALPENVTGALVDGSTPLNPVLDLVTAFEHGDWAQVEASRSSNGIDERTLSDAYASSLEWAEATARV